MEIQNARISGTHLGPEDHGIITAFVYLDYGSACQAFGGYDHRMGAVRDLATFIQGVLRVTGAVKWEHVPGKHVRVRAERGKIHEIGHFLKDDWFNPEESDD